MGKSFRKAFFRGLIVAFCLSLALSIENSAWAQQQGSAHIAKEASEGQMPGDERSLSSDAPDAEFAISKTIGGWVRPGWPFIRTSWFTPTSVADVDNNGDLEILVKRFNGNLYILNDDGAELAGWPNNPEYGTMSVDLPPLAIDLDNDGDLEILFKTSHAVYGKRIIALHHDGSPVSGWPVSFPGTSDISISPRSDDFDGDGYPEVYWGTRDYIYLVDHTGANLPGWPKQVVRNWTNLRAFATGDLNGDGIKELVYGAYSQIYAVDLSGQVLAGWPVATGGDVHFIALGDADADQSLELFASAWYDFNVYGFEANGTVLPGWPVSGGGYMWSITLGDVDGDNDLELFSGLKVGSYFGDRVYAWHHNGTALNGWPLQIPISPNSAGVSGIAIADLDGNGQKEIIIQPRTAQIFAYMSDGTLVPGFPLDTVYNDSGTNSTLTPAVADLDGNGTTELVAASLGYFVQPTDSHIFVWNVPGTYDSDTLDWPMYLHDASMTARYEPLGNQPPIAMDDSASTNEGVSVDIDVLANDSDPEGQQLIIAGVNPPMQGTVWLIEDPNGYQRLRFTPTIDVLPGSPVVVTFTYTLADFNGQTDTGLVSVTVNPVVVPPTLSFSAKPVYISPGQFSMLSWQASGATSCTASGGTTDWTGTKLTKGSKKVTPGVTTVYSLTCTGAGGSVTKSAKVTVGAPQTNAP